jgi:pimeloyl-ACP methyl ester carboxylesterase
MFIEIGTHRLEILDIAPPVSDHKTYPKPPIVLLHEGLGCVAMWRDFPQALATATGARVVAYSRYGYGQSTPLPAGARSVRNAHFMHDEAIETAPQVFEKLGIEKPVLVGHSDGGSIALICAATYPSAVSGVVVMAPHCFVEDISVTGIAQARHTFEITDLPQRLSKYHRDAIATFYGWNDVWLSAKFRQWNITVLLSAITCPVLAIQGENDEYGTMAQIDAIKTEIPSAQLLKLAQCGHSPWKEAAYVTMENIAHFYSNCAAGI